MERLKFKHQKFSPLLINSTNDLIHSFPFIFILSTYLYCSSSKERSQKHKSYTERVESQRTKYDKDTVTKTKVHETVSEAKKRRRRSPRSGSPPVRPPGVEVLPPPIVAKKPPNTSSNEKHSKGQAGRNTNEKGVDKLDCTEERMTLSQGI